MAIKAKDFVIAQPRNSDLNEHMSIKRIIIAY